MLHPLWLSPVWPSCGAVFYFSKCSRTGAEQESEWSGEGHELVLVWHFIAQEMDALRSIRSGCFNPEAWLKWNRIIEGRENKLSVKLGWTIPLKKRNSNLKTIFIVTIFTSVGIIASGCHLGAPLSHRDKKKCSCWRKTCISQKGMGIFPGNRLMLWMDGENSSVAGCQCFSWLFLALAPLNGASLLSIKAECCSDS